MTERIQFNRLEAAREESRTRDRDVPSRVDSLDGLVGSRGSTPCRSVHYCDHCHSRRDRCRHRQNRSDVSCPWLAGPEDANENLAAKDETNEARGTQCENADRSDPLGSGLAIPFDPAPQDGLGVLFIVPRASRVERDGQPDRRRDGPSGPVHCMRRPGQNLYHCRTEAQSKHDAGKDCEYGPDRPRIFLCRHVFRGGFPHRSGLGLHPRLAWAIGVMAIALSLVSRGWTGWGLYLSRFRPLATEAPFCSDYVVVALVPRQARPIMGGHLTLSLRLLG